MAVVAHVARCWLVGLVVLGMLAGPALARPLHTVLEDDDLALFSGPAQLDAFVGQLRWLGVDELRVSAEWKLEVPAPDARRAPPGFVASAPSSYTGYGMALLDRAVRAARGDGLDVIIDPAFSAPLWATGDAAPARDSGEVWFNTNIDVHAAATWEAMLARRYSGTYVPPGAATPLPRVRTFTLWNEPNDQRFVTPQWRGGVAVSADWYRRLVDAAYPAIKRVAPWARVLIGNTSYSGSDLGAGDVGVAPLTFIRRLACVDAALRPVSDGVCASFRMVPGDGYAHHPYERDAPPWVASGSPQRDWAQMGDLPRLEALLGRLVAMHRLAPGVRDLWLTEQGYESNAELRDKPWSEAQQAQLNAVSEYLARRQPAVSSFSQFLVRDTLTAQTLALRAASRNAHALVAGSWTTGLVREDGQVKPSLAMFRSPVVARVVGAPAGWPLWSPLVADPAVAGPWMEVWGRVRPARVPVAFGVDVDGLRVAGGMTDGGGAFDVNVPLPPSGAPVRFSWAGAGIGRGTSPETVAWRF